MAGGRLAFALGLVLIVLVSGCTQGDGKDQYFKEVSLSFSDEPTLNVPVVLTLTIKAFSNTGTWYSSNSSFEISLPDEFELIDGDLSWTGYIGDGEVLQHNITVKIIEEGKWKVLAWAGPQSNPRYDADGLYITVSDNTVTVSRTPFICTGSWEEVEQCTKTWSKRID